MILLKNENFKLQQLNAINNKHNTKVYNKQKKIFFHYFVCSKKLNLFRFYYKTVIIILTLFWYVFCLSFSFYKKKAKKKIKLMKRKKIFFNLPRKPGTARSVQESLGTFPFLFYVTAFAFMLQCSCIQTCRFFNLTNLPRNNNFFLQK